MLRFASSIAFVLSAGALLWACGGARTVGSANRDAYVLESDSSYVVVPYELLGARVEVEQSGPDLIRCYENDLMGGEYDLSQVRVDLVISGGRPQVRLLQQTDSWRSFAGCLETVMLDWDLDPEVAAEGAILPIEFGPRGYAPE